MFIHSLGFYVIAKALRARINASMQEIIQILCCSFADIRHRVWGCLSPELPFIWLPGVPA
jgi:hypothetical protein